MSEVVIGFLGQKNLGVGYLPGRKRPSLYFTAPGWFRTVATFRGDEEAEEVKEFILAMVGHVVVGTAIDEKEAKE